MRALARTPRTAALLRIVPLVPIVVVAALAPGPPRRESVRATAATGNVRLADSRGGGAIVSAAGMQPGDAVSGAVTLRNDGDASAALTLSQSDLRDVPSPRGGRLSQALFVQIDDLAAERTVYDGPLAEMAPLALSAIPPGGSREFRFTVSLPSDRGNRFTEASASVRYDWTATAAGAADPGGPGATPPSLDRRAPRLRLAGKRRQRVTRRGLLVYATCDEACTLRARARGARGVRPRSAAAHRRTPLRIRFGRRARRKLAWRRVRAGAAVTVTVKARDAAGNRTVAERRVKIGRARSWIDGVR